MKRALLVGIDHYPKSNSLHGCVADATELSEVLTTHADGSPNWRTELVIGTNDSPAITRDSLRQSLTQLFANARDSDLLFFFAGHGAQSHWGADLVTQDATPNSLGVSMSDLITLANDSPARSVTLLLDCCFSGDTGNTPGLQTSAVAENFRIGKATVRENVTIMAASRATEPSQESNGHGAFTRLILDGLSGGATDHRGTVTALSLYGYISPAFDAWEQRPVLKAYLNESPILRVGPPWLEPEMLRKLPHHFESDHHRLQLTPEHEGEGRPLENGEGTILQQEFDYLGRLRNANLVTTDNRRDHYWTALESGHVYLTPLGRYFWRLAKKGSL